MTPVSSDSPGVTRSIRPWAGLFGGVAAWYLAHELGLYFSDAACGHGWIVPLIHVFALTVCLASGMISFNGIGRGTFAAAVGSGAAALFAVVILWQGIASLVYSGCAR